MREIPGVMMSGRLSRNENVPFIPIFIPLICNHSTRGTHTWIFVLVEALSGLSFLASVVLVEFILNTLQMLKNIKDKSENANADFF